MNKELVCTSNNNCQYKKINEHKYNICERFLNTKAYVHTCDYMTWLNCDEIDSSYIENKIYKFKIYIYFKDDSHTFITTYDDNDNGDNIILISKGCYTVSKTTPQLKNDGQFAWPIENNIKEINVTFEEYNVKNN